MADLRPHLDDADTTPAPDPQAEQRITLDGEPDEVWDLLTDPDLLAEWLGRPVDFDLDGPGSGILIDIDGTEREVHVVESRPGRGLRWHWWPIHHEDDRSTVEITLTPVAPGTEVHVIEMVAGPRRTHASARSPWTATRFVDLELALLASRPMVASFARR